MNKIRISVGSFLKVLISDFRVHHSCKGAYHFCVVNTFYCGFSSEHTKWPSAVIRCTCASHLLPLGASWSSTEYLTWSILCPAGIYDPLKLNEKWHSDNCVDFFVKYYFMLLFLLIGLSWRWHFKVFHHEQFVTWQKSFWWFNTLDCVAAVQWLWLRRAVWRKNCSNCNTSWLPRGMTPGRIS